MIHIAQTDRLEIRHIEDSDLADLAEILGDPEVMRYSTNGPEDAAGVLRFIQRSKDEYEHPGFSYWAVIQKDEDKLIGICGIRPCELDGRTEIELSYRLNRRYQGQGYAIEAAKAVKDYAFDRLAFNHLVSVIESSNERSASLAQKLGMIYEKDSIYAGIPVRVYLLNRF